FAEDGTPFLAMALVEGCTLAEYCRESRRDWRSRVGLLLQICDAVAHAHRNLMVHRDLKPNNIMVTPPGVPMLLDFGIAKLLDGSGGETRTGLRALTPQYAAPEQIGGGEITTATDVFALGVILRETCASDPRVPRDLHSVVAKATRAEAERRYPDARAFGEDLDRLLQQRAVTAIPDSPGYRLRKLLQRHRAASIAVAGIAVAVAAGLVGVLWQAQLTREQARDALAQATRAEASRDFLFSLLGAGDRER